MASQHFGRYKIIRELGEGGMAVVYLAHDPQMDRQIAIKVLPRQFTFDPNFRARFQREAKAIASLEHPAIVPVYDYGETDDQPYIVMRYMPGRSLADRMAQGPLGLPDIARIFQRLAAALDAAHQRNIVHRDLKPANILFDQWGEAYLSDFGIVKLAEGTARYTGTGIIGTPAYMSPEQARGDAHIDGRSDIYALGVILFELLTHQLPYEADTPMGLAVAHIIRPVPEILTVNPNLPKQWDAVVKTALAKEAGKRFPTATALAVSVSQLANVPFTPLKPPPPAPAPIKGPTVGPPSPPPPKPSAVIQPGGPPPAARPPAGHGGQPPPPSLPLSKPPPPSGAFPSTAKSRAPIFALTGAAGLFAMLLAVVVCLGGAFAISQMRPTETGTPTASLTPTRTASPSSTSSPTLTSTLTQSPTATETATETPTETATLTATRTIVFFTRTPTSTPAPVCTPPEIFDPALNRCRILDSGGGGDTGGGDTGGGAPTRTRTPTPPVPPTFAPTETGIPP